ncbi:MAG: hypothetical protein HC880_04745, partial [Bacteroidia bacterium]|nr:hypothetical protein [Bacteroidia bacterium]
MRNFYLNKKLLLIPWLISLPLWALAQNSVSGVVKDAADGTGLPGVNVVVEGTTTGTITDVDGKYTLTSVSPNARLIFTFVGYLPQTIDVNNQQQLT